MRVLIDLFDSLGTGMRISEWDAARLHALDQTGRWQFPRRRIDPAARPRSA
ncbi:hypothetical protein ACU4GD_15875 [Cupriavidus basilensis]